MPLIVPVTKNIPVLTPVPPGVVTAITPEVPPAGTANERELPAAFGTGVGVIGISPSVTPVAPVKLVPEIVTFVPTAPLPGENDVIVGGGPIGGMTVKLLVLVAIPAGFATAIGPVSAPPGTVALICVAESIIYVDGTPLNLTETVPIKFDPVIVTDVPTGPLVGVNDEIDGAKPAAVVTVKFGVESAAVVAVPIGAVTEIGPLVAPFGTTAVICVSESTVNKDAGVPLKLTPVAPEKLIPLIVTADPIGPIIGEKELTAVGGIMAVRMPTLAIPNGRTWVPAFSMGEANAVKGCSTTKMVK